MIDFFYYIFYNEYDIDSSHGKGDRMEKFNPNSYKNDMYGNKRNGGTLNNFFVPVLIVACSCLAMVGITFSSQLVENDMNYYKIKIDIINGKEEVYEKTVASGAFRDVIESDNSFGSITCTKGSLNYDPLTNAISSVYINENTSCVLVFMDDAQKSIKIDELTPVSDNTGISYYYKADATNNYIKLDDELFRIIRINGNGTIRVMLDQLVLSSVYGAENYLDSSLKTTLDNWYDSKFKGSKYVVEGDFDYSNYEDNYDLDNLYDLDSYYYGYVGTLSVREVALMSEGVTNNFLNVPYGFYLMNANGLDGAYRFINGKVEAIDRNIVLTVRPVINIKIDSLDGDGTLNNPYIIK